MKYLNLTQLSFRRTISDLIIAFKSIKGLVDIQPEDILDIYASPSRGPSIKIRRTKSKYKALHNYFGNRISVEWNKLPKHVLHCETVGAFRSILMKVFTTSDGIDWLHSRCLLWFMRRHNHLLKGNDHPFGPYPPHMGFNLTRDLCSKNFLARINQLYYFPLLCFTTNLSFLFRVFL